MLNYVSRKRFNKNSLQGNVDIPYGTSLLCINDLLFYNKRPVCYITSQDAFDYFVTDYDNRGILRGQLLEWILLHTSQKYHSKDVYDKIWEMIWSTDSYHKFKMSQFVNRWLWSFDFYNAPIEDLQDIVDHIKIIEQGDC